jgi:hypothetical protein
MGFVERFPGGRPKGGSRGAALRAIQRYRAILRLKEIERIEAESAERLAGISPGRPSDAERLDRLVGRSLDVAERILTPKLKSTEDNRVPAALQEEMAKDILCVQTSSDESKLHYRRASRMPELLRRLEAARLIKPVDDEF